LVCSGAELHAAAISRRSAIIESFRRSFIRCSITGSYEQMTFDCPHWFPLTCDKRLSAAMSAHMFFHKIRAVGLSLRCIACLLEAALVYIIAQALLRLRELLGHAYRCFPHDLLAICTADGHALAGSL